MEPKSINEVRLIYENGNSTKNGKTEVWEDRLTDYQKNKKEGKYEEVAGAILEVMEADAQSKAKEWDKVKSKLIEEFGSRHVDNLYAYHINNGMPLDLFIRLKDYKLPLIEFTGLGEGAIEPYRTTYLCTIYDRTSGTCAFQRFLTFSTITRSLVRISTQL